MKTITVSSVQRGAEQNAGYLGTQRSISRSAREEGFQTMNFKINVLLTNTIYRLQFELNHLSGIIAA